jgi:serine palmitoyltransferase
MAPILSRNSFSVLAVEEPAIRDESAHPDVVVGGNSESQQRPSPQLSRSASTGKHHRKNKSVISLESTIRFNSMDAALAATDLDMEDAAIKGMIARVEAAVKQSEPIALAESPSVQFTTPIQPALQETVAANVAAVEEPIAPVERRVETPPLVPSDHEELEEAPLLVLITTYLGYLVLILFGHIRDFFGKSFKRNQYSHLKEADVCPFCYGILILTHA